MKKNLEKKSNMENLILTRFSYRSKLLMLMGILLLAIISSCADKSDFSQANGLQKTIVSFFSGAKNEISDFQFLRPGMSYKDILQRIGYQHEIVYKKASQVTYELADGKYLNLYFEDENLNSLSSANIWQEIDLPIQSCKQSENSDQINLSNFCSLEYGMSLDEVYETVGLPYKDIGSGLWIPIYQLEDGWILTMQFLGDAKLEQVYISYRIDLDENGSEIKLPTQ